MRGGEARGGDRKATPGCVKERAASGEWGVGAGRGSVCLGTPEMERNIPRKDPAKGRGTQVFNVHCLSIVLGSVDCLGQENSQANREKLLEVGRHWSV